MSRQVLPTQIDEVLPQTQCGLCTYNGCMPYAEAIVGDNAAIDLCPPGGVKTLQAIARLVNEDPQPFIADMAQKAKPKMLAVIREDECIGCTKCIQACPVDAILGSGKLMHTVIAAECTGCELCVAPCPVDCIDMFVVAEPEAAVKAEQSNLARQRYNAREERLAREPRQAVQGKQVSLSEQSVADKRAFIEAAIQRSRMKKTPSPVEG
jgi:electron transport complex protein RnfB